MTTFLVYTYKDDAEILLVTIKQLISLSASARIIVVDDAHRPMMRAHADAIRALGCVVEHSTHFRNGNLLGQEHTLYHALKMKELAPKGDDIVVKFDPDTVFFDLSWIDSLRKDSDAVMAGAYKVHISYIMGMAYAVKGVALDSYLDDVKRFPSWIRCLEDYEVSSRLYRLTDGDPYAAHRYNINAGDGWMHCNFAEASKMPLLIRSCKVFNGGACAKTPETKALHIAFINKLIEMRSIARKEKPCTTSN